MQLRIFSDQDGHTNAIKFAPELCHFVDELRENGTGALASLMGRFDLCELEIDVLVVCRSLDNLNDGPPRGILKLTIRKTGLWVKMPHEQAQEFVQEFCAHYSPAWEVIWQDLNHWRALRLESTRVQRIQRLTTILGEKNSD